MPKKNKNDENREFFAHFSQKVTQPIVDFANNTALLSSRYLFVRRVQGIQFAYCTHCKKEYVTEGKLKHNDDWQCGKCKSLATVKGAGIGRKYMVDDAYFVWYEKSLVNPEAIVARGIYVKRDYSGDYYKAETVFRTAAMYLFEPEIEGKPGKGKMLRCTDYWSGYWGQGAVVEWYDRWREPNRIITELDHSMRNKSCYLAIESVVSAVNGTPFQYSTWKEYLDLNDDLVQFFDLASRYRCIEFLTKIGLRPAVVAKLAGNATYGAINWNGKTPEKVLRLTRPEIKEMNKVGAIRLRDLRNYQVSKKDGSNLNWQDARALSDLLESYRADELKNLLKYAPIDKIKRYFVKQLHREKPRYKDGSSVLTAWRDYLKECKELGYDTAKERILFPNDLYAAHVHTASRIKVRTDEKLNAKIARRFKDLQKYVFEYEGLFVRPARDSIELFQEGKALEHCVGGYAEDYAAGSTNIFVIRKVSDPSTPFYTMEVIFGPTIARIEQCQGFKHCDPTEEVKAFINAFKANKLLTKKRTRVEIAV